VLGGVYEGHEGLDRWWADLNESFASVRLELDEIIDTGRDQVVTTQRAVGRFAVSGIEIDAPWASVFRVREGKISRATGYTTRRKALEAVGLED
jgi:ketosteroid isomerase-like protein